MNIASIQNRKDKKSLKEIDLTLSRVSLLNIVSYFAIFIFIVAFGGLYKELPSFSLGIGTCFIFLALARILLAVRFSTFYAKGPGRWRNLFFIAGITQSVLWSVFLFALVMRYGLQFNTLIAWLFTLALSTLNFLAIPAYYKVNKIFLLIYILPSSLVLFFQGQQNSVFLALFLLSYYLILSKLMVHLSGNFWSRIELKRRLKQKIKEVDRLAETSKQTSSAKDEFLSTLTHDVRTPVSSVLGILSMLKETDLDEVQTEYVSIASRAANTLLELIEDVLEFANISTKSLELDSTLFDINKVIKNCVETHGPSAHEKGIELSYVSDPDLPSRVIGDPIRLEQIISNLVEYIVGNAERGEVLIKLEMDIIRSDAGLLKVSVMDTNKAFTPEEQASLFHIFASDDRQVRNRFENTRLGLAISKGLISCMRGEMGVNSSDETGCEIWFTAEFGLSSQNYETKKVDSKLQNLEILVIGASQGIKQFLDSELSVLEAELTYCQDIESAKEKISSMGENSFDLALIDMPLESLDYLEFSATLADNDSTENTRQIIFSTLVQRGDQRVIDHIESYANVLFLTKPLRRQNLQDAVNALFEVKTHHEEPDDIIIFSEGTGNNRILVVEDDEISQTVLKSMLEKLGYSALMAGNGKEATEIFLSQPIDLILMDCLMPEMDGYEATDIIRKSEKEKPIPIIGVTASTAEGEESRCLAVGMDDYMAKPVKLEDLSLKITHWLNKGAEEAAGDKSGVISMAKEKEMLMSTPAENEADVMPDNDIFIVKK